MNRELVLVGEGLLAMTIHSVDETIVFGAPSGPPWLGQLAIILLLVALTALHSRLGRWRLVPAAVLVLLGVFVVSTGRAVHVQPLLQRRSGPANTTGVLFLLGGVFLLVSGVLLLQHGMVTWRRTAGPLSQ